jgi:hypothetical protein
MKPQRLLSLLLASGLIKDFPPSQKVGSFSLDQVLQQLSNASTSGK